MTQFSFDKAKAEVDAKPYPDFWCIIVNRTGCHCMTIAEQRRQGLFAFYKGRQRRVILTEEERRLRSIVDASDGRKCIIRTVQGSLALADKEDVQESPRFYQEIYS